MLTSPQAFPPKALCPAQARDDKYPIFSYTFFTMFNKLKQFKDMRDQAKHMKDLLDEVIVVGSGAGGKVMVTFNGSHEVLGVQIDDDLDRAKIAQGVQDAITDANKKLQSELMKKMQDMGGGLDALKSMMG